MKNKILSKKVFESTYVVNNPDDIKKLKATNALGKDDVVTMDNEKKSNTASTANSSMTEPKSDTMALVGENENTETKKEETKQPIHVEYLSNIKDEKPFDINGDKYEFVYGLYPNGERKPAVYCFKDGTTISYDWFEEHLKPHRKLDEENNQTNENNIDTTNLYKFLKDALYKMEDLDYAKKAQMLEQELLKHFDIKKKQMEEGSNIIRPKDSNGNDIRINMRVVDPITNNVGHVMQFALGPNNEEMVAVEWINGSKTKVLPNTIIVNDTTKIVREQDNTQTQNTTVNNINIPKLQQDVKILVDKMEAVAGPLLKKIDKPVEQAEFIAAMAERVGVPRDKLSNIIGQLRTISNKVPTQVVNTNTQTTNQVAENKIKKKDLVNLVTKPNVIKTIKVKDIKKNEKL